jgi:hypothetical protein
MDLLALKNSDLISLASNFKTGLCQVRGAEGNRAFIVNGNISPSEGDQEGKVSMNRQNFPELGCGGAQTDDDYLACMIRTKIIENQCFPSNRITQLIALGNLSDAETVDGFVTSPTRIKGELVLASSQFRPLSISPETGSYVSGPWQFPMFQDGHQLIIGTNNGNISIYHNHEHWWYSGNLFTQRSRVSLFQSNPLCANQFNIESAENGFTAWTGHVPDPIGSYGGKAHFWWVTVPPGIQLAD